MTPPPGEGGPRGPDDSDSVEPIWERLSKERKQEMLNSWSRQLDALTNDLVGKTALTDSEQARLRSEMDEIWAKLARIIEAGPEFGDFSKLELLPGQTRVGALNAQLTGMMNQYRASQQTRFELVQTARGAIDTCRTAIRLIRESLDSTDS